MLSTVTGMTRFDGGAAFCAYGNPAVKINASPAKIDRFVISALRYYASIFSTSRSFQVLSNSGFVGP
jgi:hypothetical protein